MRDHSKYKMTYGAVWMRKYRKLHPQPRHPRPLSMTDNAIYKRTIRHFPLGPECELCSSTENLQRHHPDLKNYPDIFVTLCSSCHNNHHNRYPNSLMKKGTKEWIIAGDTETVTFKYFAAIPMA